MMQLQHGEALSSGNAEVPRSAPTRPDDDGTLALHARAVQRYTDIHLCVNNLSRSLVFDGQGPLKMPEGDLGMARALLEQCRATGKRDFMLEVGSAILRGRLDGMPVDSDWYKLRITEPESPRLDRLPSPLSQPVVNMLMSPHLCSGGLIYICGAPGAGKTTTGSSTIGSRLNRFGGVACTLENPPERTLNGWQGQGYCYQGSLDGDTEEDWAEAFRNVLRSQPTGTLLMMYVGEVRDGESARAMLQAATNGFLVVATGFGTDTMTGLQSLVKRAANGEDDSSVRDMLATVLRLVVHQELMDGIVRAKFLASATSNSPVAVRIRHGGFNQLGNDMQFQSNQAMLKRDDPTFDLFEELKRPRG